MTPWDWLAPSTASRTRVSYTGRRGGALVVEFELDALAAGDVLDRHLAERRRPVASQARKIDDGEALGRRLHVVGHIGAGELAQLLDHPIGGQFAENRSRAKQEELEPPPTPMEKHPQRDLHQL